MTLGSTLTGVAWSAPWWLALVVAAWRWRGTPSLASLPRQAPDPAPLLSVIVPARNEAVHIGDCVRAILASEYPALELIVVDDHSTDATARLARDAAHGDARLTLVTPPPLPAGWLGKQWACHHGFLAARGAFLLFTDADVRHAPDLHARLVRASEAQRAALTSVAGFQETRTFWERVVQPYVFAILAQWYGGPGAVNRARDPRRKIANGQCLLFRRDAYEAFGGHVTVRGKAAEDLAFAQQMTARGQQVFLALGSEQMSTRMYASLRDIVEGWGKNVYSAGRETLPGGAVGQALARLLIPAPALLTLAPVVAAMAALSGVAPAGWGAFGASASLALLAWHAAIAREFRLSPPWALSVPLAALVYLYIAVRAVWRGDRVQWKGREYVVRGE
ncbi:MAG: glycosyltransferase [Gemmatimonadaceae bacterium]